MRTFTEGSENTMLENTLWMLFFMALTAYLGTLVIKKQPKRIWLILMIELALICRYAVIFVMYSSGTEASGTDGLIYHQIAKEIAQQLKTGTPLWRVEYKYTWYTALVGIQYALFGVNRYVASFLNAFLAIFSGYLLTGIALNLKYSFKKSFTIGLAYVFMPSMMVWTTDTRKESLIFFIAILIWYLVLKVMQEREWPKYRQMVYIASICFLLWVSTMLRIYMLFTIGGGILVGLFFNYLKTKRRFTLVFAAVIFAACLLVTFNTVLLNMRDYHALPMDRSQGGDEDIDAEITSIIDIIQQRNIPKSVNGFLTEPHIDNVANITDIAGNYFLVTLVRIEMVFWYGCMILALFGFLDAFLKWKPYLLGTMAYIISYSLVNALISESVADTYYRYRAAIVAPVLLFADPYPFINNLKEIVLGEYGNGISAPRIKG